MKKERLHYMDFTRAICALGIVLNHISAHITNKNLCFLTNTPSGLSCGYIIVTVFFIMSGAALYYNYPKIESLKLFYYKRWKSIMIMFLFAYAIIFTIRVINNGELFWNHHAEPWTLVFTFFGVDGYFYPFVVNYRIIGEWFLGALIILYLLYPLLLKTLEKRPVITFVAVLSLYVYFLFFNKENIPMNSFRYLTTCCLSFTVGILLMKYGKILYQTKITIILFGIFVALLFVPYPKFHSSFVLFDQMEGLLLFLLLNYAGKYIMNTKLSIPFNIISNLSYPIFLIQHVTIIKVLNSFASTTVNEVLFISIFIVVLCIIEAKMLSILVDHIVKSKHYMKFESLIIGQKALNHM